VPSAAACHRHHAARTRTLDEACALWGGKCILFDNGPRLRIADNPAIEYADRITIEAWVNTLSWPTRAVVCGKFDVQKYVGERSAWFLRDERLAAANPQASLGRTVRTLQMNVSNDAM
jgi:hypothetical protein